ncbi:hypothetical protein E3A20_05970 [Planctomyces bekefii]|uniref:VWFA domain-containing protein n=1 Tax=Planctomyces bekefii TaxID=1653850 RepID=A0A5C6M7U7_9PLAN|nr:hypothetical protein E3A20_05970 [Planctomyces bekefii]
MSDQIEYPGFADSEFAENPDPRVPCVLLLDTSGSMAEIVDNAGELSGETGGQGAQLYNVVVSRRSRIDLLNDGLFTLKEALAADSLASRRAEIAVVTFGGTVTVVQDFVTAASFQPPRLHAGGNTPMGEAILIGLDMVTKRKATYRSAGVSHYRPWIFLITDGGPDPGDPWRSAAAQVKQGEAAKSFAFFTVAVEGANTNILSQISTRPPAKLKGVNFREMFLWLSQSMRAVSQSTPNDVVTLLTPGWTEV